MKTYEIIQLVEMTVRHRVRATNASMANDIATARTRKALDEIARKRSSINFGDIADDYVPARDPTTDDHPFKDIK